MAFFVLALLIGCGASAPPTAPRSPLGTVLDGIVYWSTELPFNDVFKTSGAWMSGTAENWDDHRPLDLDEHGWVRSLRPGRMAVTLMMWGSSMWIGGVHRVPVGRYTVEYEGEGMIEYNGASVVEHAPGRDVIELAPEPPDGGLALMITTTNPRNYIRNIRVLLPDARPGETFNPRFLESLRGYRLIRFLGWMVGPSSEHVDLAPHRWAARRTMQSARWDSEQGGVPFEVMIDLANRLDVDAWFSIPHLADDAYVRGLAELLRDRLEPERKVYVEHANEVWNPMFSSNAYATKRGIELGLAESSDEWTRDYEAWTRYHARRTREIGAIFREVLGRDRVVVILATQAEVPEISEALLGWNGTAADVDALATAAYFGYDVACPDSAPLIERWTLDDLFQELESKTVPTTIDYIAQQAEIARRHGVRLVAYEAGQHLVRLDGDESPHATELFDAANRDPRMGPLYTRLITEWSRLSGGDILVHLMHCGQSGKAGRWGLIEYQGQPREEAPKYDAVMKWMEGGSGDMYLKNINSKVLIGSYVDNKFEDTAYANLVAKEFSAGQSLWYAAWGGWPSENSFYFEDFNAVVNWLRQNGISTHMHMLVGSNFYMPEWLVKGTWTNEQLDALLKNMIYSIMDANDNKNKVDVWNVVNEAIDDDGNYVTTTDNGVIWYQLGWEEDKSGLSGADRINARHPVFIRKAFQYARDKTKAKLEYRDDIEGNNLASGRDRNNKAVYQLLKHMLNSGIPVDVVGIQGHCNIGDVDRLIQNNELQNTVEKFKALGLEVHITELDIGTADQTWDDTLATQQKTDYYNYLQQAINGGASRIYFWGIADGYDTTWRTDEHPLPWDKTYKRKPAYYGIVQALKDTQ